MTSLPGGLIVIGGDRPTKSSSVEYYDAEANEWIKAFTIDTHERFDFNAIILDEKLIIVGGEIYDRKSVTTVTSYDFTTGETTDLPPLSTKAQFMHVAVVSRHLYVMGGYEDGYISRVERYSSFTNKWENVAPMLKGRYQCGTAVLNGEIYVMGGFGPSALSDVEVYNPIDDSWRQCAPMKEARICPSVASLAGYIYVSGDSKGLTTERYDPALDQWTYVENTNIYRWRGEAEVLNNKIIVAGGYDDFYDETDHVESYDPETNKWTTLGSLYQPRAIFDLLKVSWSPMKKALKAQIKN